MTQVNIDEKLAVNTYAVDYECSHIKITAHPDLKELKKLVIACPAGLYKLNEDGSLLFDYAGCLECGTCRILCDETILEKWRYPKGSLGIELHYG